MRRHRSTPSIPQGQGRSLAKASGHQVKKDYPGYGFVAFYDGERYEFDAVSSFQARCWALSYFRPPATETSLVNVVSTASIVNSTVGISEFESQVAFLQKQSRTEREIYG